MFGVCGGGGEGGGCCLFGVGFFKIGFGVVFLFCMCAGVLLIIHPFIPF